MLTINAVILQRNGSGQGQTSDPGAQLDWFPANRIEADSVSYSSLFIALVQPGRAGKLALLAKNFGDIGTLDNPQNSIPHQVAVVSAVLAQGI